MADVAAEAHVSVKTVSRVVNHEPGVRPDTAERGRAVIERLGFRRHDGARLIRQGRTFTIGLVVEDLANPFYSLVGAAVEREARIRQHQLITASAEGSPSRERAALEALIARRVDGIVVVPASEAASADPEIDASGTPIVYMDRPVRGTPRDTVLSDNQGGVRSAIVEPCRSLCRYMTRVVMTGPPVAGCTQLTCATTRPSTTTLCRFWISRPPVPAGVRRSNRPATVVTVWSPSRLRTRAPPGS